MRYSILRTIEPGQYRIKILQFICDLSISGRIIYWRYRHTARYFSTWQYRNMACFTSHRFNMSIYDHSMCNFCMAINTWFHWIEIVRNCFWKNRHTVTANLMVIRYMTIQAFNTSTCMNVIGCKIITTPHLGANRNIGQMAHISTSVSRRTGPVEYFIIIVRVIQMACCTICCYNTSNNSISIMNCIYRLIFYMAVSTFYLHGSSSNAWNVCGNTLCMTLVTPFDQFLSSFLINKI